MPCLLHSNYDTLPYLSSSLSRFFFFFFFAGAGSGHCGAPTPEAVAAAERAIQSGGSDVAPAGADVAGPGTQDLLSGTGVITTPEALIATLNSNNSNSNSNRNGNRGSNSASMHTVDLFQGSTSLGKSTWALTWVQEASLAASTSQAGGRRRGDPEEKRPEEG